MFFSVLTKNLNWEITKYLVTFKRWDGVKDEKFNIMGIHWKIRFLGSWKQEVVSKTMWILCIIIENLENISNSSKSRELTFSSYETVMIFKMVCLFSV